MTDSSQSFAAKAADWWTAARANPLFPRALIGAALIVLADQASKMWILHSLKLPELGQIELSPIFDLTYVENRGASFGMLAGGMGSRILLSAIVIGVVTGLTIWLGKAKKPLTAVAIAFIIGGALGNLYDRISYGYVVDFLDFSGLYFPWVFNVADASINVGVGLLLFEAVLESRDAKKA